MIFSKKEQFEAFKKYMELADENQKLWHEASKNGFENLKPLDEFKDKNAINLSMEDLKRIGSTEIGEEFVRFVSRYGLRFSRLD